MVKMPIDHTSGNLTVIADLRGYNQLLVLLWEESLTVPLVGHLALTNVAIKLHDDTVDNEEIDFCRQYLYSLLNNFFFWGRIHSFRRNKINELKF